MSNWAAKAAWTAVWEVRKQGGPEPARSKFQWPRPPAALHPPPLTATPTRLRAGAMAALCAAAASMLRGSLSARTLSTAADQLWATSIKYRSADKVGRLSGRAVKE